MDKKKKLKINLTSFHQHINFKLKLIKYQIPIKKRKLQKIFHFGYFFIKSTTFISTIFRGIVRSFPDLTQPRVNLWVLKIIETRSR